MAGTPLMVTVIRASDANAPPPHPRRNTVEHMLRRLPAETLEDMTRHYSSRSTNVVMLLPDIPWHVLQASTKDLPRNTVRKESNVALAVTSVMGLAAGGRACSYWKPSTRAKKAGGNDRPCCCT